jgi:hypothetical protein
VLIFVIRDFLYCFGSLAGEAHPPAPKSSAGAARERRVWQPPVPLPTHMARKRTQLQLPRKTSPKVLDACERKAPAGLPKHSWPDKLRDWKAGVRSREEERGNGLLIDGSENLLAGGENQARHVLESPNTCEHR